MSAWLKRRFSVTWFTPISSNPVLQRRSARLLRRNDFVHTIRADIDGAFPSLFRRERVHRFSLRAKIAARLQGLDVIFQVLWLTLDDHGAEDRAVAMYSSRKSSRKPDKGSVRLTVLQVAPKISDLGPIGRGGHSGRIDPDDIRRVHVDRSFSTVKRFLCRKDEVRTSIDLDQRYIGGTFGSGNVHFAFGCVQKEPTGIHISAASGSSL